MDRLLDAKELAEALHLSESTVRRMAKAGEIPAERYRDCWRFDLAKVRAARQAEPTPDIRPPARRADAGLIRRVFPWPTHTLKGRPRRMGR